MAPKLPIPFDYKVESKFVKKEIQLHFMCPLTGTTVHTTSSDYKKWIKLGACAMKVGKSVVKLATGDLTELANVTGVMDAISRGQGAIMDGIDVMTSLRQCHDHLVAGDPGAVHFLKFVEKMCGRGDAKVRM